MTNKLILENQVVFFKNSDDMFELEDESITLVVTSPPYWNVRDYGDKNQIGLGQSYKEYINSMNKVWKECLRVLQPNGKICINVQPLPISADDSKYSFRSIFNIMNDIEQFFRKNNCFLSGMHFWDKSAFISNVSWGSYPKPTNIASNTSFEQIYTFVKEGKTRKISKNILDYNLLKKEEWLHWAVRCIWDDINPVIKINSKGENRYGHEAPFPEDIPYRLIKMHTVKEEKVLDPFLGSGTTLKVTRITKRKGIGYEINSDYKDIIKRRILEDWEPPKIEIGYKTIGLETLNFMFNTIIDETQKRKDFSKQEILEITVQKFLKNNLITKNQSEKILKRKGKQNDENQEKTLDQYFGNE